LLTDEQLSHSARYVLETLPAPEAGKALRQALGRTSGTLQVGIINSLAMRHDSAAVPDLEKLLSSPDLSVAVASAEALGRIGGSSALSRLQSSVSTSDGALHQAEADALLMCARTLLDSGQLAKALKVFSALYASEKDRQIRAATFVGMLQASGKRALPLELDAIRNGDTISQPVALHLAAQLPGVEATKALAALAADAKLPVQLALIDCLVQRGDPAASPTVVALANSPDAIVRLAAIAALGKTGDEPAVRLLAEKAASSNSSERNAARQSLLDINHGAVTERMVALLQSASPQMKSELIRALGGRGD
jgi:HEAT repeat protein